MVGVTGVLAGLGPVETLVGGPLPWAVVAWEALNSRAVLMPYASLDQLPMSRASSL